MVTNGKKTVYIVTFLDFYDNIMYYEEEYYYFFERIDLI